MNSVWHEVLDILEKHDSIFYAISAAGIPEFTEKIPTAAVQFDREGKYCRFFINPNFWTTCSDYEKAFAIAHECLHLVLNHGKRSISLQEDIASIAMDVVVNHMLVKDFEFRREEISFAEKLCWLDTVFSEPVPDDREFEFYYQKLLQDENFSGAGNQFNPEQAGPDGNQVLDDHSQLPSEENPGGEDFFETVANQPNVTQDDVEEFKEKIAGTEEGTQVAKINKIQIVAQKDWNAIIRRQSASFYQEKENWLGRNRRYSNVKDHGFILPQDSEIEDRGKKEVWFFQDVSGSCRNLLSYFAGAALSFPRDKFSVQYHFFDTRVERINKEVLAGKTASSRRWFGGTRFDIIESFILRLSPQRYPDAIFIFTDGAGNYVHPKMPDRWHWFLSNQNTKYIPKTSHVYNIQEYALIKKKNNLTLISSMV